MKTQEPLTVEMTQEIAAFDHLRRQIHQRHGVKLALTGHVVPSRRNVQHCKQIAMGIEHRARGTGQPGVAAAKMLVAMDGHRLTLDQAGADAIGALPRLAPVGAQPQTGALENPSIAWLGHAIEDDPAGIGQ
ncbi:hypothetical protein AO263_34985 [Pseudomonas sp. NZIPFR-PS5]|nr:hypothetical protein AO263_34985 [Pseudomonas sp. NZIPFR-PS5]